MRPAAPAACPPCLVAGDGGPQLGHLPRLLLGEEEWRQHHLRRLRARYVLLPRFLVEDRFVAARLRHLPAQGNRISIGAAAGALRRREPARDRPGAGPRPGAAVQEEPNRPIRIRNDDGSAGEQTMLLRLPCIAFPAEISHRAPGLEVDMTRLVRDDDESGRVDASVSGEHDSSRCRIGESRCIWVRRAATAHGKRRLAHAPKLRNRFLISMLSWYTSSHCPSRMLPSVSPAAVRLSCSPGEVEG